MTNKEAIANLNHIYGIVSPDIQRSLDLAFKALEEQPQGKWKLKTQRPYYASRQYYCSNCNSEIHYSDLAHNCPIFSNYCPNCGAKMKGGKE